jgi:hypothetical protein
MPLITGMEISSTTMSRLYFLYQVQGLSSVTGPPNHLEIRFPAQYQA